MNRFERKYEAKSISKPVIPTETNLNSSWFARGHTVPRSEISVYSNRAENYLSSWGNVLNVERCFYSTPVQFLSPRIHSSTLPCRNENVSSQPTTSSFPVPPFPESANLRYFPRRYLWTWTLTHTNNFLSFLSVLWNVSFCWSMLVTLLPPRLKCPIMLFHKISWNEILSFMLKCHWINDIQESKVSSFINFIICKFIVINIAFYKQT